MGAEKKGVGGFLQLFDWNAKSRKKLFSSKSDLTEHSKQKKRCNGNLPITRIHVMDDDEIVGGSSIKGSSDYSCASSVTDEDYCGTKAPGVVARLMGLDSLPTSSSSEPYLTPFSDSQSLQDFRYYSGTVDCNNGKFMFSGNLHDKLEVPMRSMIELKDHKPISRPIEKFQKEILPPKSAKSIPITHHKLLSPIKRPNFISSKDAAHIMEAAARIIEPGPQVTAKAKISSTGSSSVPLKLRDLKEKAEAVQKPAKLAEACRRPAESIAAKNLKGQSMIKSWNGSVDTPLIRSSSESEECPTNLKKKGKSISLALQAKENVQKREGLNLTGSKNMVSQKEPGGVMSSHLFKSQQSTSNSTQRKSSTRGSSSVLRQNNQKQNCLADIGRSPSKLFVSNSPGRKGSGDSTLLRQRSSNKNAGNCRVGSRRSGPYVSNDGKEGSFSSTKDVSRKKRCISGNFQFEKSPTANNMSADKSGNLIQSGSLIHRKISESEECKRNETEIVSFTFTAPMARSKPAIKASGELGSIRCEQVLLSSDSMRSSKGSPLGKTVYGGDDLSTLLEQKLRELTRAVEASQQKAGTASTTASVFQQFMAGESASDDSTALPSQRTQDMTPKENLVETWSSGISLTDSLGIGMKVKHHGMDEINSYIPRNTVAKQLLDCRLPSPISVLETSFFSESCNSTDTADSNNTVSKLCSSVQAQEILGVTSLKRPHLVTADADLSDSASSTSPITISRKHVATSSMVSLGKSTNWELEYIKEILCNVELMFNDFTMSRVQDILNPHLFDQLEGKILEVPDSQGCEAKLKRRVLFDCVSECLDLRCRQYAGGGFRAWAKGFSVVRRKERLAEEVYNEISSWSGLGHCMVDELVDKDMGSKFGKWVDFDCEAFELGLQIENRLLNSLIDEVVADILVL